MRMGEEYLERSWSVRFRLMGVLKLPDPKCMSDQIA